MSGKYLLVEVISDSIPAIEGLKDGVVVKYFDNLVDIQSYICNELVYDELDIEDFKNPPYSGVEERLEEHGSSYYIFEGEEELVSLIIGDIKDGDWEKFLDICLPIKESKILGYKQFNESKKDKFPNIKKLDINGFVVYVGRDAKSNDHLTFNVADKEDIWMHVKGVPGSHVVIRVRENLPTKETIKLAAELAKKNSKIEKGSNATVVYCQRKFVKKEKGMNDGQVKVDYINADEIIV
jgi:hypothetical protein